MIADFVFYLGLALILVHEMDAIHEKEWRFFLRPGLFDDQTAYRLFTAAHAPLYVAILAAVAQPESWFVILVDAFLIVHTGLHVWLARHPLIGFRNWFSQGVIWGAGLAGLAHLVWWVMG